jgi:hypothetical protein
MRNPVFHSDMNCDSMKHGAAGYHGSHMPIQVLLRLPSCDEFETWTAKNGRRRYWDEYIYLTGLSGQSIRPML